MFVSQLWINGGFLVEVLYTFNVYIAILYLNFVGKFFSIQPMLRGHSLILFNIENNDNEQPNWWIIS